MHKPWMRRQPAPADCPAQTESVQPLRLILCQPRIEHVRLPGRGCRFESGQLRDDVHETGLAMETRPREKRRLASEMKNCMNSAAVTGSTSFRSLPMVKR